ncbi:MAG TPA: hypothetical protein VE131_15090, partial [Terriglobales bacterium]|nr:hypothetical protein [Terriglobales bacterium]
MAETSDLTTISQVERLLDYFESHEAKEEKSLEKYREILKRTKNPPTRFLLQLIVSDEESHRMIVQAMASTLKGSLNWSKPAGALEGDGDESADRAQLLASTDEFIDLEKEGIREYKLLLKESADYYHGLFTLLLRSIIRDSEKH